MRIAMCLKCEMVLPACLRRCRKCENKLTYSNLRYPRFGNDAERVIVLLCENPTSVRSKMQQRLSGTISLGRFDAIIRAFTGKGLMKIVKTKTSRATCYAPTQAAIQLCEKLLVNSQGERLTEMLDDTLYRNFDMATITALEQLPEQISAKDLKEEIVQPEPAEPQPAISVSVDDILGTLGQ
jgi:hypothetical protein